MKNRKLLLVVSLVLALTMSLGGTLAYLTDTDEAVNVMTLGNVKIEQHEKDGIGDDAKDFVQSQPLYPAYVNGETVVGAIDKVVTVENTGKSDAYVRTWIAFEVGTMDEARFAEVIHKDIASEGLTLSDGEFITIENVKYYVVCATYNEALAAGKTTLPSLKKVYMDPQAKNEDVAHFGETYEILVYTQAVQTANMENLTPEQALNAGFGENHPWVNGVNELPTTVVRTAAELKEALEAGGTTVVLGADIEMDADATITIAAGKTARLDLAGYTLSGESDQIGENCNMIDVRGTLTVNDGTIEYVHTGDNMGWSNSTNIFNVTAGGVLNLNGVNAKNLGGSDMAFVAHLNNWGEVTLNVNNCDLQSNYVAVRVFNSGYDMNNVSIYNSTIWGDSRSFWVHNYTAADFGSQEQADAHKALLNLDIENGTNTFIGDIRYGMTDSVYVEMPKGVADDDALIEALENGKDVVLTDNIKAPAAQSSGYGKTGINVLNGQTIDGNGQTLSVPGANDTWDSAINTTGGIIKNLTIDAGFRGVFINHNSSHSETVVLENVTIDGPVYTISCDQGTGEGLEATNCIINGWTSYAATLGDAKFVDCYFGEGSGYAYCRPYAPTEFVGCEFETGFKVDPVAAVTFENCTIDGQPLTAENVDTLVTNTAQVTVK